MADPAHPPGSRAITIPYTTLINSNRRRQSNRSSKTTSQPVASAASLSSLSSDQDSSSCTSRTTPTTHHLNTIASPSKDPHLPTNLATAKSKGKAKQPSTPPSTSPTSYFPSTSPLGPSMLSSSSYKSIDLNSHHHDPDEPPRLITYTKHSQGFTWNDELFLPSYLIGRYGGRRRRKNRYEEDWGEDDDDDDDDDEMGGEGGGRVEVVEVFVSDEEARAMWP